MSFSSSWILPSISPKAPFIIRLMVFSRFPSLIKFAIRFALSSKEPVPVIKTSTCSLGRSLMRFTASFSNVVSTFPSALFRFCAIPATVSTECTPFRATWLIASPRATACSLVRFRLFLSPSKLFAFPENVSTIWEARVRPADKSACLVTKSATVSTTFWIPFATSERPAIHAACFAIWSSVIPPSIGSCLIIFLTASVSLSHATVTSEALSSSESEES